MANSFFVPYNHQPTNVVFRTSPYTLGANEYARLVPLPHRAIVPDVAVNGDQGITINGSLAIPQTQWHTNDYDAAEDITIQCSGILHMLTTYAAGVELTYAFGRSLVLSNNDFNLYKTDAGTGTNASSNQPVSIPVHAGTIINFTSNSTNFQFQGWLQPFEQIPTELWLEPSTVVSSGDGSFVRPYMLEIYSTYS